jgi:serine/threonine-protein kinase HipA
MNLTLQIHWDNQWHDAGIVTFRDPGQGLLGSPTFSYDTDYVVNALDRAGDFEQEDLIDRTAVGVKLPCIFGGDYTDGEIIPVLRDIIPQGAGRRHWVKILGFTRDPEHTIDTQLLSEGCVGPVGNLRIKEAAERFEAQVAESEVLLFDRADVCTRADNLIQYAHSFRLAIGGASGAGGDAPKLLLAENYKGQYALEGTIPDQDVARHWLVKFPRGKKSSDDIRVLEGEAAIYQFLEARGYNSIPGAFIDKINGHFALWLPRFDRKVTPDGVLHHGMESIYSMMGIGGDGARLEHVNVIHKLRECVTKPDEQDALLADYLVRDILNTATGNRDNHGRNTSLIKRDRDIELAPAYDVAPMVLDPEAIAMSTWWPNRLLNEKRNPDYAAILEELAVDNRRAAALMVEDLLKLTGMAKGLEDFGAPDEVVNHKAIRMHEPELVLKQLERLQG